MTKRVVDFDADLLSAAQEALGTTGVSDTVRAALRYVAESSARARQVAWLQSGGLSDMAAADTSFSDEHDVVAAGREFTPQLDISITDEFDDPLPEIEIAQWEGRFSDGD